MAARIDLHPAGVQTPRMVVLIAAGMTPAFARLTAAAIVAPQTITEEVNMDRPTAVERAVGRRRDDQYCGCCEEPDHRLAQTEVVDEVERQEKRNGERERGN